MQLNLRWNFDSNECGVKLLCGQIMHSALTPAWCWLMQQDRRSRAMRDERARRSELPAELRVTRILH